MDVNGVNRFIKMLEFLDFNGIVRYISKNIVCVVEIDFVDGLVVIGIGEVEFMCNGII